MYDDDIASTLSDSCISNPLSAHACVQSPVPMKGTHGGRKKEKQGRKGQLHIQVDVCDGGPSGPGGWTAQHLEMAGSDEWLFDCCHASVHELETSMNKVLDRPMSLQCKVILLRCLARMCEAELLAQDRSVTAVARQKLQDVCVSVMCRILRCKLDQVDQCQLLLQVRHSGFGFLGVPYLHDCDLSCAATLAVAVVALDHEAHDETLGPPPSNTKFDAQLVKDTQDAVYKNLLASAEVKKHKNTAVQASDPCSTECPTDGWKCYQPHPQHF